MIKDGGNRRYITVTIYEVDILFMGKPLILSEAPVLDQPCTRREATFRDADARRHRSRADKGDPP